MFRLGKRIVGLFPDLVADFQWKPTVVLLYSTVAMCVWWYFGSPEFYHRLHENRGVPALFGDPEATAGVYTLMMAALLFGVGSYLVIRLGLREGVREYGVRLGRFDEVLKSCALLVPVFLVMGYLSASDEGLRAVYPLNRSAGASPSMFAFHVATYLVYYLAWEFHFRGFLQHGLRERMGPVGAILIQTMASTLVHLGHPASETFGAIAGGILWGALAFRTKSLLPGLIQHAALGITLDFAICYLT